MGKYLKLTLNILYSICLMVYGLIWTPLKLVIPYKYRSKNIKGEIVLVTGSGSGIGKLLSKKLARLGARLVLVDIDPIANERTANEILIEGGNAKTFTCDLSKREEIYKLANEIKEKVGEINILINNAGIVTGKKFLESSDSAIIKTFQVNTMAHFWLTKSFLPSMIEKNHGHVVTMASMAGLFGSAGLCDYCASKYACIGFDESLRNELLRLGKTGVKTTVVCPNYISTGMFNGFDSGLIPPLDPDYVAQKMIEAILTNQKMLLLPRLMYYIYALKGIISNELESHLSMNVFKSAQAMDTFVGRKNN